jgi:hypothetical protein
MRKFFNAGHKERYMKKRKSRNGHKANHKKNLKNVPLGKSLGELMKDEDGFVSKETILKVGLSTVAALGMTGVLSEMGQAGHYNASHSNFITIPTPAQNCVTHTNVTTHTY